MKKVILKKRGFSLIELVVIIAMTGAIAAVTFFAFRGFSNYQVLDKETDTAQSFIEKARLEAINSHNFADFGIRFASTTITIFQGSTYAASTSNIVHDIPTGVQIGTISLTGGAYDVDFENVTGEPNATGTVTFRLTNTPTMTKSVIIYGTGLSEVQ